MRERKAARREEEVRTESHRREIDKEALGLAGDIVQSDYFCALVRVMS
jgi:hypothetical protein